MKKDPLLDELNRHERRVLRKVRWSLWLLVIASSFAGWLLGVLTR